MITLIVAWFSSSWIFTLHQMGSSQVHLRTENSKVNSTYLVSHLALLESPDIIRSCGNLVFENCWSHTIIKLEGRLISVDSSAPTILLPQDRVPSTTSSLLSFIAKFVFYLSCEKNKNKQKETAFGQKIILNFVKGNSHQKNLRFKLSNKIGTLETVYAYYLFFNC